MKKICILFTIIGLFAACQKEPDTEKLDNDFPVYTDYASGTNFGSFTTFYIPDSVLIIDNRETARYWTDTDAESVLNAFIRNMQSRGYVQTESRADADLGIQVSYIEDVNYFYGYYDDPYWWWEYPGYWGPGYWGNWGGWYYPYPVVYTYNTGSLLAEMVDLNTVTPTGSEAKLPVVWTAYMGGLLSGSDRVNTQLAVRAIDQAFAQSTYIKR